jgi:hypothetical protein
MRSTTLSFLLALALVVPLAAQRSPERLEQGPVFRLSVSLVQVDAVVTDRKGHHVTTLGPADFRVLQDG